MNVYVVVGHFLEPLNGAVCEWADDIRPLKIDKEGIYDMRSEFGGNRRPTIDREIEVIADVSDLSVLAAVA
jgi:hypothetical protein